MRKTIPWSEYVAGLAGGIYRTPDAEYSRLRKIARQLRGLVAHVSTHGARPETAWYRHQTKLQHKLADAAKRAEAEFERYATANNFPLVKPWIPRRWSTVKRQQRQADLAYRPTKRRAA
jgi:hypothetical protein